MFDLLAYRVADPRDTIADFGRKFIYGIRMRDSDTERKTR